MADYYWVGGSGTWDYVNKANWSLTKGGTGGAGIPTATDSVWFCFSASTSPYTVSCQLTSNQVHCGDIRFESGSPPATSNRVTLTGQPINFSQNIFYGGIFVNGTPAVNVDLTMCGVATSGNRGIPLGTPGMTNQYQGRGFRFGNPAINNGGARYYFESAPLRLGSADLGIQIYNQNVDFSGLTEFNCTTFIVSGNDVTPITVTFSSPPKAVQNLYINPVDGSWGTPTFKLSQNNVTYQGNIPQVTFYNKTPPTNFSTNNTPAAMVDAGGLDLFMVTINRPPILPYPVRYVSYIFTNMATVKNSISIINANSSLGWVATIIQWSAATSGGQINIKALGLGGNVSTTGQFFMVPYDTAANPADTQVQLNVQNFSSNGHVSWGNINWNNGTLAAGPFFGDMGGNTNILFSAPKTVYISANATLASNVTTSYASGSPTGPVGIANKPLPQDTVIMNNLSSTKFVTDVPIVFGKFSLETINWTGDPALKNYIYVTLGLMQPQANGTTSVVPSYIPPCNFIFCGYGVNSGGSTNWNPNSNQALQNGDVYICAPGSTIKTGAVLSNGTLYFCAGNYKSTFNRFSSLTVSAYHNVSPFGPFLNCVRNFSPIQFIVSSNSPLAIYEDNNLNFATTIECTYSGSLGMSFIYTNPRGTNAYNGIQAIITGAASGVLTGSFPRLIIGQAFKGTLASSYFYGDLDLTNLTPSAVTALTAYLPLIPTTATWTWDGNSGIATIKTNGRPISINRSININGVGGTFRLTSPLTLLSDSASKGQLIVTGGTFDDGGYAVTATMFQSSYDASSVPSIIYRPSQITFNGTSKWTLTGPNPWNVANPNLTVSATAANIVTCTSSTTKTFTSNAGGISYGFTLDNPSTTGPLVIKGASNTFSNLSGPAGCTFTFPAGNVTTINSWNLNGVDGNRITVNSSTTGTQATIASPNQIMASYLNYKDLFGSNGPWYFLNSNDLGNNTNINSSIGQSAIFFIF